MPHIARLITLIALLCAWAALLVSCATTSPEAQLQRGYITVAAAARSARTLLEREAITAAEAQRVLDLGDAAYASLNDGKARLQACRAAQQVTPSVQCTAAAANIELGAAVLNEIEHYLETRRPD